MTGFLAAAAALAVGAALAEPAHFWDFDKLDWNSRQAVDLGADKAKFQLAGRIATGQGSFGSDALRADAGGAGRIVRFPMPYGAWTFDCSFRMATPLGDAFRPLFRYETSASEKDGIDAGFADGRLVVRANGFSAASEDLKLSDGTRYALRLSVTDEGRLRAWLDGGLVLEKAGAPSFRALGEGRARDGYPCLRVGGTRGPETLDGAMDDVAFHDRALDAPETPAAFADYANIALPEYRPVASGKGAEVLVLGADGRGGTGRFHVADVMDTKVFGQMNAADPKFVKAASSATVSFAGDEVRFVVECPVPPGMTTERHPDLWSGDRVEIFVRTKAGDPRFVCYAVNVTGKSAAGLFGGAGKWSSRAKLSKEDTPDGYRVTAAVPVRELFAEPPRPGDSFGVNFRRFGRTCGNHSSWATVGGSFNDAKYAFGTVVFGGAKPYFRARLAALRARTETKARDGDARQAVARVCRPVENAIEAHADDAQAFASLEAMFRSLEKSLLAIVLKGRPHLLYEPANAWGNAPEPDFASRPLELVRIRTPRNMRSVRAFALANFRDEGYVGNLKFFDRYDGFYRTGSRVQAPTNGVARHFTVRRAVEIRGRDGRPLFDPLADLPLGTTVEVPAGKTALFFAEFDSRGLRPGRYYALLKLQSAVPGHGDERVAVEVTVTDDDLDALPSDKMGYSHFATSYGAGGSPVSRPVANGIRQLVARGYNVVFLSRIDDMYPVLAADGTWRRPSYRVMDAYVDAWLAAGLDPKRIKLEPFVAVERETPLWKGLRDHAGKRVPFGSPAHDEGLRAMVKYFAEHVSARYGIGKDRIIWYPVDEAHGKLDDPAYKSSVSRCRHAGRVIREQDAANVITWNPLPDFLATEEFRRAQGEFAKIFDYITLYRPKLTQQNVRDVQASGYKAVWGSHITGKDSSPEIYRNVTWKNLRDGFSGTVGFWHLDESATLDSRGAHCYGSCYVDWDLDTIMLSRRQLAADMAAEEGRLVGYLRWRARDDAAQRAQIDALVAQAADEGTMAAMDAALEKLLGLLSRPPKAKIRVASWNVGHFANGVRSRSRVPSAQVDKYRADYTAFVRKIDADVFGVAEYARCFDEAQTLPTRNAVFGDYRHALEGTDVAHFNALFVRDGWVTSTGVVAFAEQRQGAHYVVSRARVRGVDAQWVMTHLDPRDAVLRRKQIEQLVRDFRGQPRVVIAGDFNVARADELAPFAAAGFALANDGSHPTWPSPGAWANAKPESAVDNIVARGFRISDFRVHPSPPLADHCLVCCALEPTDEAAEALETAVWQSAVDAASKAGGGRVVVPAGRHLVGQIDLRSNVELHLEKDAVLEGAVGLEHYRVTTLPYSEGTWSAVVSAIGVTNVAITGEGEIFGNGTAWPQPENYGGNQEGRRPRGVFFADCRDVRLRDFTLRDSACWGVVFKCCENVDVRRVKVDSHANANNDGIDVEARNVVIADCDIDAGDDGICLKSNDPGFVVENVLVTNVVARSHCNALKLGTASHGTMRNVLFVDCRTEAPRRDFIDRRFGRNRRWYEEDPSRSKHYPGRVHGEACGSSSIVVENVDGGMVENVTYRNITVEGACVPIFIRAGTRSGRSCGTPPSDKRVFRNVLIENVAGEAMSAVANSVTGVPGCRIANVTLRNVRIVCRGGGENEAERTRPVPEVAGKYPDAHMFGCMLPAYGLYVRHVDGLKLENVSFAIRSGDADRREAVVMDDVSKAVRLATVAEGDEWVALENKHEIVKGSALDFSKMGIQDAPAGKYGWVKSVNGHAEFEKRPGRAARFYGVNLCGTANYLSDEKIERLTDRLVRLGYNSIRIHHHDDMWAKDTDGARDKLDRLVAACVRKGLYLTTDLYVSRKCTYRELGVDEEGEAKDVKLRMMSGETAFDNWKKFSKDFLTRVNPYTGRSLADESAMPFIVLINESSPHSGWDRVKKNLPEFRELWRRWLTGLREQVPNAYPEADPDKFPERGGWWNPGKNSDITAAFWAWCNESFCKKAAKYLREELKVKALLATENNGPVLPELLRARAAAGDYVDFHFYTEHAGPASKSQQKQLGYPATARFHNRNVLADCRRPYRGVAFNRVWGRPLTVSESNMGGPNTWRAMAGLVTGAYAAIQDWTSVWTFAMAHADVKLFDGCDSPPGRFDLALDPILQATDRLPALLFLRGDQVTPKVAFANVFTKEAMNPADDKCLSSRPSWTDCGLSWRARLGVAFDEPLPDGVTPLRAYPGESPAEEPPSAGVTVDEKKGEITVVGPFTCGGYALAGSTVVAGPLSAKVTGHRALVAVTSLGRTGIARSPRLLLWHLTDVHGEGFSWGGTCSGDTCSNTGIGSWGTGRKLLVHAGRAEVALTLEHPENYAVYALDTIGNRQERLTATVKNGRLSFTADVRQPTGACLYYEIVSSQDGDR